MSDHLIECSKLIQVEIIMRTMKISTSFEMRISLLWFMLCYIATNGEVTEVNYNTFDGEVYDICGGIFEAINSANDSEYSTPSPMDINICNQMLSADYDPCTFDASSCENECLLGYESDQQGCQTSCYCTPRGLFEGDIKFDESDASGIEQVYEGGISRGADNFYKFWNETVVKGRVKVPYRFDSSMSKNAKKAIKNAIVGYSEDTCIDFVQRTNENDYIEFVKKSGCWSYIGKRGGRQEVSIGNGCTSNGIIQHEMMHALGFWHEQSRPDRDNFVTILTENIISGRENNFKKRWTINSFGSAYDFGSVMHYNGYTFSKNNKPTVLVKATGKPVKAQRNGISAEDIFQLKKKYRCSELLTPSWTSWESWGDCSVTCGSGTQTRDRQCLSGGSQSTGCEGSSSEEQECIMSSCPELIGSWGSWVESSECSKPCGGGYQWKYRECVDGIAGESGCPGTTWEQSECNTQDCQTKPSLGSTMFTGDGWVTDDAFCEFGDLITGDYNGDGYEDVICFFHNWVRLSTGSETDQFSAVDWEGWTVLCESFSQPGSVVVGDFNADGKDDLLCHNSNTGSVRSIFYSEENHFNQVGVDWEESFPIFCIGSGTLFSQDVDGDLKSDLICRNSQGVVFVQLIA